MLFRTAVLGLLLTSMLLAQDTRQYTYDLNGRRFELGRSSTTSSGGANHQSQTVQTINGRSVPLETAEERVLQDDANGKIVERTIRRRDANGNQGPPEKIRLEERKSADGSTFVQTTVYRGDLNGNLLLAEKTTVEARKIGKAESSNTVVERPSLNGSLDVVEKKVVVGREIPGGLEQDATIMRKDGNGRFYEAVRQISERREAAGVTTESTTEYEAATSGKLELSLQTRATEKKGADGSLVRDVDIYGKAQPGRVSQPGQLRLREQQRIERKPAAGGAVETFSIRRPGVTDDSTRLGPFQKISETVCTGKCT